MKLYILLLIATILTSSCITVVKPQTVDIKPISRGESQFYWHSDKVKASSEPVKTILAVRDPLILKRRRGNPEAINFFYDEMLNQVSEQVKAMGFETYSKELTYKGGYFLSSFSGTSEGGAYLTKEEREMAQPPIYAGDLPWVSFGDSNFLSNEADSDTYTYENDDCHDEAYREKPGVWSCDLFKYTGVVNTLTVSHGHENWKKYYQREFGSVPSLFIYVGLIEVRAEQIAGDLKLEISEKKYVDGNKYLSDEAPINVIALKGIKLNEFGDVVSAGVHGLIPIQPKDYYEYGGAKFNSIGLISFYYFGYKHQDIEDIGSLDDYDLTGAINELIDRLNNK